MARFLRSLLRLRCGFGAVGAGLTTVHSNNIRHFSFAVVPVQGVGCFVLTWIILCNSLPVRWLHGIRFSWYLGSKPREQQPKGVLNSTSYTTSRMKKRFQLLVLRRSCEQSCAAEFIQPVYTSSDYPARHLDVPRLPRDRLSSSGSPVAQYLRQAYARCRAPKTRPGACSYGRIRGGEREMELSLDERETKKDAAEDVLPRLEEPVGRTSIRLPSPKQTSVRDSAPWAFVPSSSTKIRVVHSSLASVAFFNGSPPTSVRPSTRATFSPLTSNPFPPFRQSCCIDVHQLSACRKRDCTSPRPRLRH
ncbi:hypothetical protein DFH07DRAFT_325308 [Mycena maculata]|uniref:Uncharacterized protein n=1 Tax=Mycena maculata TaxID=230809 RepID=A0AAD7KBQ5_9AGAR|nr:hypothetical protein DFH07DRAFT_325308 [Mycena maculata]